MIGGAEIGALELGKRLISRGHLVSILTPRLDPSWRLEETIEALDVYRYDIPDIRGRDRTASVVVGSYLRLGTILRRLAPDVLNMHYLLPTGIAGQWWASRLGIPTVLTLIGMDIYDPYYRPSWVLRHLMRRAARRTDAVTCVSTFVQRIVAREYAPMLHAPFTVIPYGVDTKRFCPGLLSGHVRDRYGVWPHEKLVLTVQRLYKRKGVHEFVEAAALVAGECPATKFLIVGEGPERASLERLVLARGLQAKVMFAGAVENQILPLVYAACDLFLFHTFHEGFGIVLLEAMASGLPVITTAAGGTVDIIRNGENGIVVRAGDHIALARAAIGLLRDDAKRAAIGRKGRKAAVREFDWDIVADKYLDVFLQVRRSECSGSRRTS